MNLEAKWASFMNTLLSPSAGKFGENLVEGKPDGYFRR
jgi:hypothetical protein